MLIEVFCTRHSWRPEFSERKEEIQRRRPPIYNRTDQELVALRGELEAANKKIQQLTDQLQASDKRVVVHEVKPQSWSCMRRDLKMPLTDVHS